MTPPVQGNAQGTGKYFDTLPTPDPRELSFRVRESAVGFQPTTIPTVPTTYGDSSFLKVRPRIQLEGFADYVFTRVSREGDFLWFHYGKNKTSAQMQAPFRSFWTTRRYTWPAVLEDLWFVKTTAFSQSNFNGTTVQSQPSYFPRYTFRPDVPYSSACLIEQFLSPTPWARTDMNHIQPVPTDVHGSWIGVNFNFPSCLHPQVVFDENVPGAQVVYGSGVSNPATPRNINRKIIPATNMLDWAPFVISDEQQPTDGLWLRERVTLYPPPRPKATFV